MPKSHNIIQPFRYLWEVLFRFISLLVLGSFEWVLDGFGSFHILVTTHSQDKRS